LTNSPSGQGSARKIVLVAAVSREHEFAALAHRSDRVSRTLRSIIGPPPNPARPPLIADLDDGQRIVASAEPALLASLAGQSLVGSRVSVAGSPPIYTL
jgi:hypothetical protein